jgi:hypothetical protein
MDHCQTACCADYEGTDKEAAARIIYDLTRQHYEANPIKCGTGKRAAREIAAAQQACENHLKEVAPQACGFALETLTLISIIINVCRIFYQWISSQSRT